jgi:hypothetical protein
MSVVRTSKQYLDETNRPEWCNVTCAGVFRVGTVNERKLCLPKIIDCRRTS